MLKSRRTGSYTISLPLSRAEQRGSEKEWQQTRLTTDCRFKYDVDVHVECREVSAAKQKGWHLHHSPDAWYHRIKCCYWISLQRSAHEKLYQHHLSPYHPPVLLQMPVPTSSPRICVCWLIWWSTCCSSMRSCCSRSAEGNCFPWPATSDMDSLSLWDCKIRQFQKKSLLNWHRKK